VSDNGAPGQKGLPQETFLPIAKTRPLGQRRHDGLAAPRPRKIEISTMLSELSYRQLRFEGRTRPLAASSVTAAGFVEPPAWHSPGSQREEPQLSPDEEAFVSAALTSAGLDSSAYRAGPVHRRLPAVLRAVRSATPIVGAARIAADQRLAERAVNTLLIGHTEPFRDQAVFRELRATVLPALTANRWGLNVWSVGCSTGAELMSVALLLAERGVAAGSRLRGTDCRRAAIDFARAHAASSIGAAVRERIPALAPWLDSPGYATAAHRAEWCVENALVAKPTAAWPTSKWDVILCRNVAIYLRAPAAAALWERLVAELAPGGVLVTGKAEKPPGCLSLVRLAKCIYQLEGGDA
jgi:chemotaxis protein methyltransferase CheR